MYNIKMNKVVENKYILDQALTLLKQASAALAPKEVQEEKPISIFNLKSDPSYNSSNDESVLEELTNESLDKVIDSTKDKLNPSIAYEIWAADKSDENFNNILKSLRPTLRYALAANNAVGDSLIETKAKVLAARAIKKYDPSYGSSLPTYVTNQLQKLMRVTRDLRSPVKIPERQLYAAASLAKAEEDWKEKHGGKEPTVSDLADSLGVSIKKIEDIRKQFLKQVSESNYFSGATDEDSTSSNDEQGNVASDFTKEAIAYVYNDLGYRDKKILEYTTGFGGSDILDPATISKKLKISQSQISRINAKLANRIFDVRTALEKVYNG